MIIGTIRFMYLGWIEDHYIKPKFHFKYWGFEWIEPLSSHYLYAIHYLMILASLGVMFAQKTLYKVAAIVLFLCFAYTELIDLTYYLNHYYFVSCVCFLLIFVKSQKPTNPQKPPNPQRGDFNTNFDTDFNTKVGRFFSGNVPNWCILILKLQISFVYIYAGLAKINYDWLFNALPLKIWLPAHDKMPIIGKIFTWQITPYVFSWVGMLYDCFIVFFLINKKTRFFAYLTVIIFHILTGLLFQIGVFPLVMIGATLIFFDWNFLNKNNSYQIDNELLVNTKITVKVVKNLYFSPCAMLGLGAFFLFQIIFPLRFLCYENNLFWSEEGYRFSWRVMLMEKAGTATFYVKNPLTGKEGIVDNSEFLNSHQEKQMSMQPDMILQFAHFLGNHYQKISKTPNLVPSVRVEAYVTLNGKPSRLLIDPNINLMNEKDTFASKNWILNYK